MWEYLEMVGITALAFLFLLGLIGAVYVFAYIFGYRNKEDGED